jgi:hypothetical protein
MSRGTHCATTNLPTPAMPLRLLDIRFPAEANDFSSSLCYQTSSEAHSATYSMGTRSPFPGGKARPGSDADRSPPSSAEVKNEYELYLFHPCRVHGDSGTVLFSSLLSKNESRLIKSPVCLSVCPSLIKF